MIEKSEIRSDVKLKELGFNPQEISEFRRNEKLYYELNKQLADLEEKKKFDDTFRIEEQIERLELLLLYQGENPKNIPVKELKRITTPGMMEDGQIASAKRRIKNPSTAIRAYCLWCQNGQIAEIRRCMAVTCPVYPFRLSRNPFYGKILPKVEELILEGDDLIEVDESEDDSVDGDE